MTILVIGANGKVGKDLVQKCALRGLPVRAMVRNAEQLDYFKKQGVEAVMGDLEGDMEKAFSGCDKVVFSAGSGYATSPHKTLLVDLWGSIQAVKQAEKHGVKHFVMVSALKACEPLRGPEKIRHYLVARNRADDFLQRSTLNYTILRPGRLLDEPAKGKYTEDFDWSDISNTTSVISREDVANLIVQILVEPLPFGQVIDMVNGQYLMDDFLQKRA